MATSHRIFQDRNAQDMKRKAGLKASEAATLAKIVRDLAITSWYTEAIEFCFGIQYSDWFTSPARKFLIALKEHCMKRRDTSLMSRIASGHRWDSRPGDEHSFSVQVYANEWLIIEGEVASEVKERFNAC